MNEQEKLNQAVEAEKRREQLAEEFGLTAEESLTYSELIDKAINKLPEKASLKDVAFAFDDIFSNAEGRALQIKKLLLKSAAAKIDESIRHFLRQPAELDPLLFELKADFNSFDSLLAKILKYKNSFNKLGVDEEKTAEYFISELKDHYSKIL